MSLGFFLTLYFILFNGTVLQDDSKCHGSVSTAHSCVWLPEVSNNSVNVYKIAKWRNVLIRGAKTYSRLHGNDDFLQILYYVGSYQFELYSKIHFYIPNCECKERKPCLNWLHMQQKFKNKKCINFIWKYVLGETNWRHNVASPNF